MILVEVELVKTGSADFVICASCTSIGARGTQSTVCNFPVEAVCAGEAAVCADAGLAAGVALVAQFVVEGKETFPADLAEPVVVYLEASLR